MDSRTSMGAANMRALLDSYVFGFVLQERSLPGASADEIEAMTHAMLEQFPPDEYPNLRAFAIEHVLQPGYSFGKGFERGLDIIRGALTAARTTPR